MTVFGIDGLTERRQAYQLLAAAARAEWGLSPLPPLAREPGGKPFFPGLEGRCFNLSHSGPLALCALDGAPVGADVQLVLAHRPGLPARVCAPDELAWLGPPEGEDYWARFAQLWALKECRVKQSGEGLRRPISSIRVPLPRAGGEPCRLDGLWFRCYTGPGWRAAVCGLSLPPAGICWLTSL